MATFLSALGFLVTLCAEQVAQALTESSAEDSVTAKPIPTSELSNGSTFERRSSAYYRKIQTNEEHTLNARNERPADARSELAPSHPVAHDIAFEVDGSLKPGNVAAYKKQDNKQAYQEDGAPLLSGGKPASGSDAVLADASHVSVAVPHNHEHEIDVLLGSKKLNFGTAVLLAMALCVHSVLEGMALGAQQSMTNAQDIMIAIAAHKGLAAYALGSSVAESKASSKRFWTVIVAFSIASPLGIFLGYMLSTVSHRMGAAALSSLASGTFLYVAMMEVIPRELSDPSFRMLKMTFVTVGFSLMSLLAVWA